MSTIRPKTKTKKGTFRQLRYDTLIGTVEKKYGVDLGARSDMYLGTYLANKGYPSLSNMLRGSK